VIDLRNALPDLNLPPFGASNKAVSALAFDHLLDCGLRNFGFFGSPARQYRYDDERRDEFQRTVEEAGFTCHVYADSTNPVESCDWHVQQQRLGDWVSQLPKPVGILSCHDEQGQELLDACRARSIVVPDEVAVLGVDNDPYFCNLSIPPLSSIDLNTQKIGYDAAAMLDRMMNQSLTSYPSTVLPPRYVVTRQSTDLLAVDDDDILTAIRFIRGNACAGITIDDVLKQVAVSRSTLNRRFKEVFGRSPKTEIVRTQLEHARKLLIETDLSVASIAARCGFSEAKYFYDVFHRRVGTTPREFRQTHCHRGSFVEMPSTSELSE
jgi:LacI family transcriptional regulator